MATQTIPLNLNSLINKTAMTNPKINSAGMVKKVKINVLLNDSTNRSSLIKLA